LARRSAPFTDQPQKGDPRHDLEHLAEQTCGKLHGRDSLEVFGGWFLPYYFVESLLCHSASKPILDRSDLKWEIPAYSLAEVKMDRKEELWKSIMFKKGATPEQLWHWCLELTSSPEEESTEPNKVAVGANCRCIMKLERQ